MAIAATVAPLSPDPLSPAHYQELALAKLRAKPVRKAARVANFNGWTSGILAVVSAPFAPFSVAAVLMTAVLAAVAYNELRGRKRLLNFEPSATYRLGWNQVGLLSAIVVYCLGMIWTSLTGPSPLAAELQANPELGDVFGSPGELDTLYQNVALAFYGSVIALTLVFQGLNAVYYFTRRKYVETCVQDTPAWALTLLRADNRE
jgi:hypothetical protein